MGVQLNVWEVTHNAPQLVGAPVFKLSLSALMATDSRLGEQYWQVLVGHQWFWWSSNLLASCYQSLSQLV